jgi:hypothetical protein
MNRAALLPILLALAACRPELPTAVLERDYQPDTEYLVDMVMNTRRSLHRGQGSDLAPLMDEQIQEVRTSQLVRTGPLANGSLFLDVEMLDYRVVEPGFRLRMNLDGCVGRAEYRPAERAMRWLGLADTSWTAPAVAPDSGWAVQPLLREDAASYLASAVDLLAAALQDSTRTLVPGQGWVETRRQETTVGPFPVAWLERRTVSLDSVRQDVAHLSVRVDLQPQDQPGGPPIELKGEGRGRMSFDLRTRCTRINQLDSQLDIEILDGETSWVARSETSLDIRTSVKSVASGKE